MAKKRKILKSSPPRNNIILAAFKREINLQTQVVQDKTKYKRKAKHKQIDY